MRFCEAVRDLRERGHLIEVTRAVDPVHELAAHVMRSAGWSILFHRVGEARLPVLYNVFGHAGWVAQRLGAQDYAVARRLVAVALGVDPAVWLACALAVDHPPAELEVAGGLAGSAQRLRD